jgi:hypothetical protein
MLREKSQLTCGRRNVVKFQGLRRNEMEFLTRVIWKNSNVLVTLKPFSETVRIPALGFRVLNRMIKVRVHSSRKYLTR